MARLILIFFTGSSLVSFLTCMHYRAGRHIRSTVSVCDSCGKPLRLYARLPVLGYLFTFGRCPYCGSPVDIRYPLSELAGGLLFVILYLLAP